MGEYREGVDVLKRNFSKNSSWLLMQGFLLDPNKRILVDEVKLQYQNMKSFDIGKKKCDQLIITNDVKLINFVSIFELSRLNDFAC